MLPLDIRCPSFNLLKCYGRPLNKASSTSHLPWILKVFGRCYWNITCWGFIPFFELHLLLPLQCSISWTLEAWMMTPCKNHFSVFCVDTSISWSFYLGSQMLSSYLRVLDIILWSLEYLFMFVGWTLKVDFFLVLMRTSCGLFWHHPFFLLCSGVGHLRLFYDV